MLSVAKSLADAATKYARRAVASYVASDFEDFYLSGGIALEQAMKARLARENPAFIAPDRAFKSALALWRTRADVANLPIGTRTIGGAEALERVKELEPGFTRHAESVREILRFRNGEAHIGAPGSIDHRGVFADFAAALNGLLRVPARTFWAEYADLIAVAIDENAALVAKVANEKLVYARLVFARKFDGVSDDHRDELLGLVEHDIRRDADDDALVVDCPACTTDALLYGQNGIVFERDGTDGSAEFELLPHVEFLAHQLECEACDLLLSAGELEAIGVSTEFVNESADIEKHLRVYDVAES